MGEGLRASTPRARTAAPSSLCPQRGRPELRLHTNPGRPACLELGGGGRPREDQGWAEVWTAVVPCSVRSGSPPGWTSAARGRGAAVCGWRLPGGGSSLRVPPGEAGGSPGMVTPSGGRVLGPGVPARPRPAACFTAGARSRALSPNGRNDAPAVSERAPGAHPAGPTAHRRRLRVASPLPLGVLVPRQPLGSAPP